MIEDERTSFPCVGYTNHTATPERIFIKLASLGKIVKDRCVQTGLSSPGSELPARLPWEHILECRCCVPLTGSVPCWHPCRWEPSCEASLTGNRIGVSFITVGDWRVFIAWVYWGQSWKLALTSLPSTRRSKLEIFAFYLKRCSGHGWNGMWKWEVNTQDVIWVEGGIFVIGQKYPKKWQACDSIYVFWKY